MKIYFDMCMLNNLALIKLDAINLSNKQSQATRGSSPGVLVFSTLETLTIPNSNFIWNLRVTAKLILILFSFILFIDFPG